MLVCGRIARLGCAIALLLMTISIPADTALSQDRAKPRSQRTETPPPPKKILVDAIQLRRAGVALERKRGDFVFPYRCYEDVTISEQLLRHYRARGFSLVTLCMAMRANWMVYHPETGEALTIAALRRPGAKASDDSPAERLFLLDIPDCFANGTPYSDCNFNYEVTARGRENSSFYREKARKIDAGIRALLRSQRFTSECTCSDLEASTETISSIVGPRGRLVNTPMPSFRIKTGRTCYIDKVPDCAERLSRGRFAAGTLRFELEANDFAEMLRVTIERLGLLNEWIEISPRLPRGYAYTLIRPEGEDEQPYTELPTGERIGPGGE